MATSTLHLKSSNVGRCGSLWEVAASRAARLHIQKRESGHTNGNGYNMVILACFLHYLFMVMRTLLPQENTQKDYLHDVSKFRG